jgi:hypothetical protein
MASTYSTSLGIELIGQGEQSGTWGITTNNNLGTLIEQAITGVQTITMSNATYTLSFYQGAADEARNAVLNIVGTNLAPQNLIAPGVQKVYLINNQSGNTVTIKTSGGNGAPVLNNSYAQVYCDGTDFYNATPSPNSIVGNLNVTGNGSFGGNVSVTGNISAGSFTGITGRIVQMVQTNNGTQSSNSGSSYSATGFYASITPTSASSKILVLLYAPLWQTNGYGGNAELTMYRNGAPFITNGTDIIVLSAPGQNMYGSVSFNYLDSPGTTSTLTYQPYIRADTFGQCFFNGTGAAVLTLVEIL